MNITITGDLGSGKSSVAKELCKILNFNYLSTGAIQRKIGLEKGMNTLELNYFAEKNDEIDNYIDDFLRNINKEKEHYVLDSRMAWHFVQPSFKIYITVDKHIAAERVKNDTARSAEPMANDISTISDNLLERRAAEDKRFKIKYGVDCGNLTNYDLVIDSSQSTVSEIVHKIVDKYRAFVAVEKNR